MTSSALRVIPARGRRAVWRRRPEEPLATNGNPEYSAAIARTRRLIAIAELLLRRARRDLVRVRSIINPEVNAC